ncbi:MAG: hypothetical protein ABIR81_01685 [Ginsengibacter sp.]
MRSFDTVTEAINDLRSRGFNVDFNIAFDKLLCIQNNMCLNPSEFEIVEIYRFEGETNPSDEDVVYAVESKDGFLKGAVTSAYGMYADSMSTEMIRKMSISK